MKISDMNKVELEIAKASIALMTYEELLALEAELRSQLIEYARSELGNEDEEESA